LPFLHRLSASLALVAALCAPATAADQHWLVVGDIHLDPSAQRGTLAPYGYDSDRALLASTIAAMRRTEPDPPVVVITGDLLAHHFHGDALATMREIAGDFDRAFPRAQFVLAPGNNDDPCGDYRIGAESPYLRAFAAIWNPLVDRGGAAPEFASQFPRGGYYVATLPGKRARAVVLDSVLWSWRFEECAPLPRAPGDDELAWLASTLSHPATERDIVVMHVPPGIDAYSTSILRGVAVVPFYTQETDASFVSLVGRNRQTIAGMIAGHEHRNDLRLVSGVPLFVASSISPIYGNNPTFYQLDVWADGTMHDAMPIALVDGTWKVLPATDVATIGSLRALRAVSPAAREEWSLRYVSESPQRDIDEGNWKIFWCAQTEPNPDYDACAGIPERRGDAALIIALLGAALVSLPLVGLLRRGRVVRRRR
jgi:hypothetical protein